MTNEELVKHLEHAEGKIELLQKRIEQLESITGNVSLPQTMILDQNFIKRAFAVYGHVFVAGLIIALPFYCCFFCWEFWVDNFGPLLMWHAN